MSCCTVINQGSVGVKERCGAFDGILSPGFHLLIPCVDCVAGEVSLRVQNIETHVESKSADNVFVNVKLVITYKTEQVDAYKAFYSLSEPIQHITVCVQTSVRSTVPTMTLDELFDNKDKVANTVRSELSSDLETSGYKILQVLISDIDPDQGVKNAMNEINTQERLRAATIAKAEANKVACVKNAEAEAESKYLSGVGLAKQRKAIIDGLGTSILDFSQSVQSATPRSIMQLVMMNQYFDTIKEIAQNSAESSLFVPHNPSAINDLSEEIQCVLKGDSFEIHQHSGHLHHE
eukprot:TRINITY_DN4338_c0_g1_i1.p1 TRINITY_DN4338_c0_g1~~TRINITY_DN4338_c0_g1_i1.p1  ORF type:complete len:292 (+),score=68.74 TRINITY_DN4338_c0_g1_i1:68-943(+)